MLEELDSCQVRDMYYIYLLLWLSRHCDWFVLGAPLHVPRPEEDDVCIGQASCQAQGECGVTTQFGMWNLLEELLFPLYRWLRCLRPGDLNHIKPADEKVLVFPPSLLASHSHPLFLFQPHSTVSSASVPSLPPASTWDMFLLLFSSCFSLKRRMYSISQKPSRFL